MNKYLVSTEYIDWEDSDILYLARVLAEGCSDSVEIAQRCFEFVRDEIKHSCDYKLNHVTCRASEVLKHRTGYCYAKSHLLAAILRANKIPAGLCYQRLMMTDKTSFCIHDCMPFTSKIMVDIAWMQGAINQVSSLNFALR